MPLENRVQAQPAAYLDALRADVRAGLTARPKTLPPKYFYDARGSELFDEITTLREFVPFDVDPAVLSEASEALSAEYPGLRVAPFLGDFTRDLGEIPATGRRTIAFIGSTIGNLEPA